MTVLINTSIAGGSGTGTGIPTGGSDGQVLTKQSGADLDADWETPAAAAGVPSGGTTGQILKKNSNTDYDTGWIDAAAADALLTSLAALPTTVGLIAQTASEVAGIQLIGVSNATDIPQRSHADTRYAKWVSGAPTGGTSGDFAIRYDKPFRGVPYLNTAGTWAIADNDYTWAGRPSAGVTYLGLVINITDVGSGCLFQCVTYDSGSTYYWVPLSRRLQLVAFAETPGSYTTGNGSAQTLFTDTIPAGLVAPYARIRFEGIWEYVGTTATKTARVSHSGATILSIVTTNAAHLSQKGTKTIFVSANLAQSEMLSSASSASDNNASESAAGASLTMDFASAQDFLWTQTINASDTGRMNARSIEIYYK